MNDDNEVRPYVPLPTTISEVVKEAYNNSKSKGFHDDEDKLKVIPEKLALIHAEVSEALEHYRDGNSGAAINETFWGGDKADKPDGFAIELADVVIRVADLCGQLGIDLTDAIHQKMIYNRSRPYKHGKKC